MTTVNGRVQPIRATAAVWTSVNPVLLQGEKGLETDTGKTKMGDGVSTWTALSYFAHGATGTFTTADAKTITVTKGIITSIV